MIQIPTPRAAPSPGSAPPATGAFTPRSNQYLDHVNATFGYPHPKQALALLLPQKEILFGGAAGGGKSDWLLRAALQYADVPGYNAIIFRKTYASLIGLDGLVPRSQTWLAGTDAVWHEKDRTWKFPSGAALKFGYLDTARDRTQYQSTAYAFIGFEELTDWATDEEYLFMFSRLRAPKRLNVPRRVFSTTNPIGPGYEWVKNRFVPENAAGTPTPIRTPAMFFLPSSLEDNPSIDASEYEDSLSRLDATTYAKLRHGSWDAAVAGQMLPSTHARYVEPHELPDLSDPQCQYAIVRYWDLAGTKPDESNPNPDWTVGTKMLRIREKDGSYTFYILDVIEVRETYDVIENLMVETAHKDGKHVYVRSEQDPGQAGKAQIRTLANKLKGFDYAGVLARGAKVVRASGLSAAWRNGRVHLRRAPWNSMVRLYFDKFPMPGVKDDHIDSASGAFNFLQGARDKRGNLRPPRRGPGTNRFYSSHPQADGRWGPRLG